MKKQKETATAKTAQLPTFNITLTGYDLGAASLEVLKRLIQDKPNLTRREYARILGVAERTFYRWIEKYNLPVKGGYAPRAANKTTIAAIQRLEKLGFTVKKKK